MNIEDRIIAHEVVSAYLPEFALRKERLPAKHYIHLFGFKHYWGEGSVIPDFKGAIARLGDRDHVIKTRKALVWIRENDVSARIVYNHDDTAIAYYLELDVESDALQVKLACF